MSTAESAAVWNPISKILVIGVYRSHQLSVNEFCRDLDSILAKISFKNLHLVGDMNIDISSGANFCNDYLDVLAGCGLQDGINLETRFSGKRASCIDNIFFRNMNGKFSNFFMFLTQLIADHVPIVCSIFCEGESKCLCGKKDNYILDLDNIALLLAKLVFDKETVREKNVDYLYNDFFGRVKRIVRSNTMREISALNQTEGSNRWITRDIKDLTESKRRAFKLFTKNRNCPIAYDNYRNIRNKVTTAIKRSTTK